MLILSVAARGNGYSNSIRYDHDHSSLVKMIAEIFGLKEFPGKAVSADDLSDLFKTKVTN